MRSSDALHEVSWQAAGSLRKAWSLEQNFKRPGLNEIQARGTLGTGGAQQLPDQPFGEMFHLV